MDGKKLLNTSYRRRTERGKVVWRCATRIEKGKVVCANSPTLNEEWIKEKLASTVASGMYNEKNIREKIEQISIFQIYLVVKGRDNEEWMVQF